MIGEARVIGIVAGDQDLAGPQVGPGLDERGEVAPNPSLRCQAQHFDIDQCQPGVVEPSAGLTNQRGHADRRAQRLRLGGPDQAEADGVETGFRGTVDHVGRPELEHREWRQRDRARDVGDVNYGSNHGYSSSPNTSRGRRPCHCRTNNPEIGGYLSAKNLG